MTYVLEDKDRAVLQRLVLLHGVAGVARMLGISRGVIVAVAGGIGVRRGSIELVREALAARRSEAQ